MLCGFRHYWKKQGLCRVPGPLPWAKTRAHNKGYLCRGSIKKLLCKLYFLGLVVHARRNEPAYTFDHYVAEEDQRDWEHRTFQNKAEWVVEEFWVSLSHITLVNTLHTIYILEIHRMHHLQDFYGWDKGLEQVCKVAARQACYKLVHDMHYEARA
ncbi:unnamed protein product [Urochloa humidicola]